ncbi:MAG: Dolichol kinase [Rickettsiales bacterium]|jgi:dolichol kinase|nr:Dolichol kinase [Rickettsiales bacterium]
MAPNRKPNPHATIRLVRAFMRFLLLPVILTYIITGSKETLLVLAALPTFAVIALDIFRYRHDWLWKISDKLLGKWMFAREKNRSHEALSGASFTMLALCICLVTFPKDIFIITFLVLIFSDCMALITDLVRGRIRFFDRSFEGAIAFFITTMGLAALFPPPQATIESGSLLIFYLGVATGAIMAAIFQGASTILRINPNFLIPLSFGGTLWAFMMLGGITGN